MLPTGIYLLLFFTDRDYTFQKKSPYAIIQKNTAYKKTIGHKKSSHKDCLSWVTRIRT